MLRLQAIKLQVALITPLYHVKGAAAPETKIAVERARLLIEEAEALGEPPEDPLLLFSVLYGFWVVNLVAFNGRGGARTRLAISGTRTEAEGDGAAHGRPSPYECLLDTYGGLRGSTSARSIKPSRFTIPASIVLWRRDLARTSAWPSWLIRRWPCGFLAIPDAALAATDQAIRDARETRSTPQR